MDAARRTMLSACQPAMRLPPFARRAVALRQAASWSAPVQRRLKKSAECGRDQPMTKSRALDHGRRQMPLKWVSVARLVERMPDLRILIADDHAMVRGGVRNVIEKH